MSFGRAFGWDLPPGVRDSDPHFNPPLCPEHREELDEDGKCPEPGCDFDMEEAKEDAEERQAEARQDYLESEDDRWEP